MNLKKELTWAEVLPLLYLLASTQRGFGQTVVTWMKLQGFRFDPWPLSNPSVSTVASYTTANIDDCEAICSRGPGGDFSTFNSVTNLCDISSLQGRQY